MTPPCILALQQQTPDLSGECRYYHAFYQGIRTLPRAAVTWRSQTGVRNRVREQPTNDLDGSGVCLILSESLQRDNGKAVLMSAVRGIIRKCQPWIRYRCHEQTVTEFTFHIAVRITA
jgi:hypothetical protein